MGVLLIEVGSEDVLQCKVAMVILLGASKMEMGDEVVVVLFTYQGRHMHKIKSY